MLAAHNAAWAAGVVVAIVGTPLALTAAVVLWRDRRRRRRELPPWIEPVVRRRPR